MKKILVIGSTGMLGKPVTRELYRAGFELSLLARDITKARNVFPNAHILQGDVLNKQTLLAAMNGQDEVYVNLNTPQNAKPTDQLPEREGIDNIIEAAKETGIRRISLLSSLVKNYNGTNGFHWWIFDMKHSAVEKIKASGIPYTIYYASMPCTAYSLFSSLVFANAQATCLPKSSPAMNHIGACEVPASMILLFLSIR